MPGEIALVSMVLFMLEGECARLQQPISPPALLRATKRANMSRKMVLEICPEPLNHDMVLRQC
jgi:hypothetical protein